MNAPLTTASDLIAASAGSLVYRSLFLSSNRPTECIDFYVSYGFRKSYVHIEGLNREFPSASNDWHTLVFVASDAMPISRRSSSPQFEVIPRFICDGGMSFDALNTSTNQFNEFTVNDPDGRAVTLIRKMHSHFEKNEDGLLCWIESSDAQHQVFVRVTASSGKCSADAMVIGLRPGVLNWLSGGLPCIDYLSATLDHEEFYHFIRLLRTSSADELGFFKYDDHLVSNTFYRVVIFEKSKASFEITAPLHQLSKYITRLRGPLRMFMSMK